MEKQYGIMKNGKQLVSWGRNMALNGVEFGQIQFLGSCSQKEDNIDFAKTEIMINDFMNDFKDSKEEYLIKEAPLDDMSTQGGEIKGYYIDNKLKYIDINIFG